MLDKKKITCSEAKLISLEDFMAANGYFPEKRNGNILDYKSPFKLEQETPSFTLNTKLNIWIDFSQSTYNGKLGGTIIDLGIRLFNCSISEFLERLNSMNFISSSIQPTSLNYVEDRKIRPCEVKELEHPELINYLKSRNVLEMAKKYCKEVHFSMNSKNYFAIGFKNQSDGWELRNKYFKGSCSPKDLTLIKTEGGSNTLICFEGFMDFLSYHGSILDIKEKSDFLILNSLAFLEKSKEIMISYRKIILLFDQDHAGTTASGIILGMGMSLCIDKSSEYKDKAKDVNEFVSALKRAEAQKKSQIQSQIQEYHTSQDQTRRSGLGF